MDHIVGWRTDEVDGTHNQVPITCTERHDSLVARVLELEAMIVLPDMRVKGELVSDSNTGGMEKSLMSDNDRLPETPVERERESVVLREFMEQEMPPGTHFESALWGATDVLIRSRAARAETEAELRELKDRVSRALDTWGDVD